MGFQTAPRFHGLFRPGFVPQQTFPFALEGAMSMGPAGWCTFGRWPPPPAADSYDIFADRSLLLAERLAADTAEEV